MPKSRSFRFVVPGTPDQVAARLRSRTRFRPLPHQSSPFGRGELGGRVSNGSFTVSSDERSVLVRRLTAVASGTLVDRGDGTTLVEGVSGMPSWVTWSLRLGSLAVPVFALFAAFQIFIAGAGLSLLAVFALGMAAMLALAVGSTGWQVTNVESAIDPLIEQLERTLKAQAEAPASPQTERQRDPRVRATEH